jgi:hypothetical protein
MSEGAMANHVRIHRALPPRCHPEPGRFFWTAARGVCVPDDGAGRDLLLLSSVERLSVRSGSDGGSGSGVAGGRRSRWRRSRSGLVGRSSASRRRHGLGCGDSRDARAEAKFLQAQRIELAVGFESVRRLEFLHCTDRVRIPFPVWIALVVAVARERRLNLGNALRRRSFLERLALRRFLFAGCLLLFRCGRLGRSGRTR